MTTNSADCKRPRARYAALETTETRWYDEETGQEHWSSPIGVCELLDCGADPRDEGTVRLVSYVQVNPRIPDGWLARIHRRELDAVWNRGVVKNLSTRSMAESKRFDDRDAAIEWCERTVEGFAHADREDAVAWYEERHGVEEVEA